jgi:signal transduction histidine kinase
VNVEPQFPAVNPTLEALQDSTVSALSAAARLAALGELTTGTIHAVNNGLFAVLANVEMLLAEPGLDRATADRLRLVQESGLDLRDTMRRLAALARRDATAAATWLDDEARTAVELLLRTTRVQDVEAAYPEEPLAVAGETAAVAQAVMHVLLHGASAAGRRGILRIEVTREGSDAVLHVRPDGAPDLRLALPAA